MSYIRNYQRKLVGGKLVPTSINKIRRGQIISFNYPITKRNESYINQGAVPRLVFILNIYRSSGGRVIHGINLNKVPWLAYRTFMKKLITQDTLTLIKRKYEIVPPINDLINRPISFYNNYIKRHLEEFKCYRTYLITKIKQPKLGVLNYSTLFSPNNVKVRNFIIDKNNSIKEIQLEHKLLEKFLKVKTIRLKDKAFSDLVLARFGTIENFIDAVEDLDAYIDENYIDEPLGEMDQTFDSNEDK